MSNTSFPVDRAWLSQAKEDVAQWAASMPVDADGVSIDWQWVEGLDLEHGIGFVGAYLQSDGISDGAAEDASDGVSSDDVPQNIDDAKAALRHDYATRDRIEAILAQCNSTFMTDFDRLIVSYRLPRALAYANRRLNDEIALLLHIGVERRWWTMFQDRRGRVTVPVLRGVDGVDVSDVQDRSAKIADARAARRKEARRQERAGRYAMARANLSGVTSPGGSVTLFGDAHRDFGEADSRSASPSKTPQSSQYASNYGRPDWRDAYLPGRDVDTVMGIDIETTGTDPARVYIIDVGFEYMNMASPRPESERSGYRYEQDSYDDGDAYGQSRLPFGVTPANALLGNPFIRSLTGIDVRDRGVGYRLFDEWPEAQRGLLQRLEQQPYVAHNATFEHGFFMLNIAGYAESYRAGRITILDTLPMSRRWDEGSKPDEAHPYGDNTLEAYAKRQGALPADASERHLGLEDSHIMLLAMKHHLMTLRDEGRGPWGAEGKSGVGGKRCGHR